MATYDNIREIVDQAMPFIIKQLTSRNALGGVSGGGGVPANVVLRDGTASLTGNWTIASGVTIDGIDIDVNAAAIAAWQAAHAPGVDPHPQYLTQTEGDALYVPLTRLVSAGNGLTGGGNLSANITLTLGLPSSTTISSTNAVSGSTHSHAIPTSSNPGAAAAILASDASGFLTTQKHTVLGASSGYVFDDRSTLTAATQWTLYGSGSQARFSFNTSSPGDKWYVDSNGYSNQTRVGAGVATVSYPLHAQATTTQMRLQYDASNFFDTTVDSGGNVVAAPSGDYRFNPTGKDVHPVNNYDLNFGLLNKKWLTIYAAELWVETLVAQNTIATIGGRVMVGPTTQLVLDLAAGATTIAVKYNNLQNGDIVYMEANGFVEFMSVTSTYTKVSNYFTYTVTRNLDGTGSNNWSAGDAIFNTGQTGKGFIDLYSYWSFKALPFLYVYNYDTNLNAFSADYSDTQVFSPFADNANTAVNDAFYMGCVSSWSTVTFYITTAASYSATLAWEFWNGSAWTAFTPSFVNPWSFGGVQTVTLGILTGWASTSVNGVAAFWVRVRITAFTSWTTLPVTYAPLSRGQRQFGPTIVGNVRNSSTFNDWSERWAVGNLNGLYNYGTDTYGFAAGNPSTTWIAADATNGFRVMLGTTALGTWGTSGDMTIGKIANSFSRVQLTASGLVQLVNRDSVGADKTAITLLAAPNAAGQIATFDGVIGITTSGGIYQGSGTFASPTTGLKIWNTSTTGKISGYNTSVEQWTADTDGVLKAGAGVVLLGATGISIGAGSGSAGVVNSLTFRSLTTGYFALNAAESGSQAALYLGNLTTSSLDANTTIETYTPSARASTITLFARNNTSNTSLDVKYNGVAISTSMALGGLAMPAGNGNIRANNLVLDQTLTVTGATTFPTESWTAPTLGNSWVNYGSPQTVVGYRKTSYGEVCLRGLVKNGTTTAGTVLFTLPAGYRPIANEIFTVQNSAGTTTGRIDIDANGNVIINGGGNTYLSLASIRFFTD